MSQFCFIYNKLLTEDETVVVSRGMPIDASVARSDEFADYLRSQKSVTIHVNWKNHTPGKLQSLHQKDNVRKNRPVLQK